MHLFFVVYEIWIYGSATELSDYGMSCCERDRAALFTLSLGEGQEEECGIQ